MLPATVVRALTGGGAGPPLDLGRLARRYEHVVLVYFDAFGWQSYERHAEHPLLEHARNQGQASKLTSQFPSTTAAHMTTIHTGLPVGVHGVYEWFTFLPKVNRIIAPLLFSFAGDAFPNTLLAHGVSAGDVFPEGDFYPTLGDAQIAAHVALPLEVAASTPGQMLLRHAAVHPFSDIADGVAALGNALAGTDRGYGFVYLPEVDTAMHKLRPARSPGRATHRRDAHGPRAEPASRRHAGGDARPDHRRSRHGSDRARAQPVRQRALARDRRPPRDRSRRTTARTRRVEPRSLPAHPTGKP